MGDVRMKQSPCIQHHSTQGAQHCNPSLSPFQMIDNNNTSSSTTTTTSPTLTSSTPTHTAPKTDVDDNHPMSIDPITVDLLNMELSPIIPELEGLEGFDPYQSQATDLFINVGQRNFRAEISQAESFAFTVRQFVMDCYSLGIMCVHSLNV